MTNKTTLIISFVAVVFFGYIVFDSISYVHAPTNSFAKILSKQFAAVGITTATSSVITKGLPPESPEDYTDNKNSTITDNYTNLVWLKCTLGTSGNNCSNGSPSIKEWSELRNACDDLKFAGKTDWRLPTLKELESIVHTGTPAPAVNNNFFVNTAEMPYWTSTSPADHLSTKFTVLFTDGSVYYNSDNSVAVARCVRGGNI